MEFPSDLPGFVHYRGRGSQTFMRLRNLEYSVGVPAWAEEWGVYRRDLFLGSRLAWRPMADLPAHWLPFLTRPREDTLSRLQRPWELWEAMYWRASSPRWPATFKQAFVVFHREYGEWPDRRWPLMPLVAADEFRRVRDVPMERLVPKEQS